LAEILDFTIIFGANRELSKRNRHSKNGSEVNKVIFWRRKKGDDIWHWHTSCPNWPTVDYVETTFKPTYGRFDDLCKAKEARDIRRKLKIAHEDKAIS